MPLRFHQRPLIVPQLIWYEGWRNVYQTKEDYGAYCFICNAYLKQILS